MPNSCGLYNWLIPSQPPFANLRPCYSYPDLKFSQPIPKRLRQRYLHLQNGLPFRPNRPARPHHTHRLIGRLTYWLFHYRMPVRLNGMPLRLPTPDGVADTVHCVILIIRPPCWPWTGMT